MPDTRVEELQAQPKKPSRPRAWIKKIIFNDGTALEFERHEIIVLVGPNNAGKSASLRDIDQKLGEAAHEGVIVKHVQLELEGSTETLEAWGRTLPQGLNIKDRVIFPFGEVRWQHMKERWAQAQQNVGLREWKPLLAIYLSTESRLQAANSVENVDLTTHPPTNPLQHLYDADELEERLSGMFKRAFGSDLVVNRGAGQRIVLHMGTKPPIPPGNDRVSKIYRSAVTALPTIQTQGDGVRAFVGVLLHTLVIDHDIILIDEPDAFLHPPQAATLGRLLATEPPKPRQLITATHSTDFLRGVLDAPDTRVRVVRIRRDLAGGHVRELSPDSVRGLWRDPLLRFSNVLDGLFHDGVIVCEGDADCRFYTAMMEVNGLERKPDLLLTYSGGKQRVPMIVKALRAIDVPVRAVLDFDVLRDADELKMIYDALGGTWSDIDKDHKIVQAAVQGKRPELSTDDVRKSVAVVLDSVKSQTLPPEAANQISAAVKRSSPWAEAKRIGKAFVPNGEATQAYERLVPKLRQAGLYLVEVGEVEQFCKRVPMHGPAWVVQALDRSLTTAPELEEARKFATSLLNGW